MNEGRFELKYALPLDRRDAVLELAAAHVTPDPNGGSLEGLVPPAVLASPYRPRGYRVCSLYLDTPQLHGYAERLAEARIRNRVRVRAYGRPGETTPVFLEAKRKLHRNVVKHRVRICTTDEWSQASGGRPWQQAAGGLASSNSVVRRWLDVVDGADMKAVCRVTYVRETWVQGTARLTLDHCIRGSAWPDPRDLQGQDSQDLLPPGWFVLELKFNGAEPVWMRSLVRAVRLMAEPVSKFALSVVHTVRSAPPGEVRRLTPPSVLRSLQEAS